VSGLYRELAARFRGEVADLERVVQRTLRAWEQAQVVEGDRDLYLDAVALNLHTLYSGWERLFELVIRHIDGDLPSGATWHRDLLQMVSRERTDVRPAVISADICSGLDEFRRFRHLVRNVYTTNLRPEKMTGMLQNLPEMWTRLRAELLAFATFLERLACTCETNESEQPKL